MSEIDDRELDRFYPDPQEEEPKVLHVCAECKCEIYEASEEYYWKIEGEIWCDDCAKKIFRYTS